MTPNRSAIASIKRDFVSFLETRAYASKRDELEGHSCLLDIIWLWLEFGDGYRSCQTFEMLLLFIIDAADDWSQSDGSGVYDIDLSPTRTDDTLFVEGLSVSRHAPKGANDRGHPVLDASAFQHGVNRDRHAS